MKLIHDDRKKIREAVAELNAAQQHAEKAMRILLSLPQRARTERQTQKTFILMNALSLRQLKKALYIYAKHNINDERVRVVQVELNKRLTFKN